MHRRQYTALGEGFIYKQRQASWHFCSHAESSLLEFFLLVCFPSRFVQEVWKTCVPGLG